MRWTELRRLPSAPFSSSAAASPPPSATPAAPTNRSAGRIHSARWTARRAEEPGAEEDLRDQREEVQHRVEAAEERPELLVRDRPRDRALEHVVAEGERDGRHQHEDGEASHVGLALEEPRRHRERRLRAGDRRAMPGGPSQRHRGHGGGEREHDGRGEDERRRREVLGDHVRRARARRGSNEAPRPHERVEPLRLRERVEVREDHPEPQHGEAAEEARPHVERVQLERAAPAPQQPEEERDRRARAEQAAERERPGHATPSPRRLRDADRHERRSSGTRRRGATRAGARGRARRARSRAACARRGCRRSRSSPRPCPGARPGAPGPARSARERPGEARAELRQFFPSPSAKGIIMAILVVRCRPWPPWWTTSSS